MNKIFFLPKRSRLAENFRSGFQMVKTKWRPFCFYHSKSGPDTFLTSLDRFGMSKILFMALINKTVYASNRTQMSGFQMVRISNGRDRHKIQSENRPRFGIRMLTVHPKAGPFRLSNVDFGPVPTMRLSEHSKAGRRVRALA